MPTEDEARRLIPQIQRLARAAANRLNASPVVRDELDAEAVGHVFGVIDTFDPRLASFSTWCFTVLRNRCVTLIRQEAARRNLGKKLGQRKALDAERHQSEGAGMSPLEAVEDAAEREARRPRFDIVQVLERHLKPNDRMLVAAYAGLLAACCPEVVDRWCREAKWNHAVAFQATANLPQRQRKEALAGIVGEKVDWVRQRIFRALRRLQDREFGDGKNLL